MKTCDKELGNIVKNMEAMHKCTKKNCKKQQKTMDKYIRNAQKNIKNVADIVKTSIESVEYQQLIQCRYEKCKYKLIKYLTNDLQSYLSHVKGENKKLVKTYIRMLSKNNVTLKQILKIATTTILLS